MNIQAYVRFKKSYRHLPERIKKKVDKQIMILSNNFRHPSLHVQKIKGKTGIWEARVSVVRLGFCGIKKERRSVISTRHEEKS